MLSLSFIFYTHKQLKLGDVRWGDCTEEQLCALHKPASCNFYFWRIFHLGLREVLKSVGTVKTVQVPLVEVTLWGMDVSEIKQECPVMPIAKQ